MRRFAILAAIAISILAFDAPCGSIGANRAGVAPFIPPMTSAGACAAALELELVDYRFVPATSTGARPFPSPCGTSIHLDAREKVTSYAQQE